MILDQFWSHGREIGLIISMTSYDSGEILLSENEKEI